MNKLMEFKDNFVLFFWKHEVTILLCMNLILGTNMLVVAQSKISYVIACLSFFVAGGLWVVKSLKSNK